MANLLRIVDYVQMSKNADQLKGRLVKADDALRCCHNSLSRDNARVSRIVGTFVSALLAARTGYESLAFVPAAGNLGRVVLLSEFEAGLVTSGAAGAAATGSGAAAGGAAAGGAAAAASALLVGAVIIAGADIVGRIAGQTAALEAASALGNAIGSSTSNRTRDDCFECLKSKLLSQAAPRQWQRARIRRRI